MYEQFYGFTGKPFQTNPDPSFYFGSQQHRRAMDYLVWALRPVIGWTGFPPEALPSSLMRSLSGSAAFAMSSEIFKIHGPDSFIGRLVSVMEDWCPAFPGLHAYYPSRRHSSRALGLVIDAIRYRG